MNKAIQNIARSATIKRNQKEPLCPVPSTLYSLLLIPILMAVTAVTAVSQGIDELGVVWSKTYGVGGINSIKPIKASLGGGYVAAGWAWRAENNPEGVERTRGLVLEIDESGNEIRRAIATVPQSYINSHTPVQLTGMEARFVVAFKTDDGGYIAFGVLSNSTAPMNEREMDWGPTGGAGKSPNLINGIWVVKFNADLSIYENKIENGRTISSGWQMQDGGFIIGGYDSSTGNNNTSTNITLLRKYSQLGVRSLDRRGDLREITDMYKYKDTDNYLAITPDYISRIDVSLNSTNKLFTALGADGIITPYGYSVSPSQDGGAFVALNLKSTSVTLDNYNNGAGLYKFNQALSAATYNKRRKPADTMFYAPLLLSGASPQKYVGSARIVGTPPNYQPGNYMYEWTDNGASYSYRFSDAVNVNDRKYPNNTRLNLAGTTDGFFSVGQSDAGLAAIAKLSVCANFVIDVGATDVLLPAHENTTVHMSPRVVSWAGQNGTVTANWTLADVTPGGAAATVISGGISGALAGSGSAIPEHSFKLNTGKTFALLRYTVTAVDTHGGTSCTQSRNILVRLTGMPDNVVDADCYTTPPATAWDIQMKAASNSIVQYLGTPFAGDLDGDGRVEVVIPNAGNGGDSDSVLIFNDQLQRIRRFATATTPQHYTTSLLIADMDGDGTAEIIVGCKDRRLRCYSPMGVLKWTTAAGATYASDEESYCVSLITADVNGSGIPLILAVDKLYNGLNGQHLLTLPLPPSVGGRAYAEGGPQSYMPVFADLDNDGVLEVVAGNRVYKINIVNFSGTGGGNQVTSVIVAPSNLPDGFTSVADIDMDGDLDVIVTGGHTSPHVACMYVWDGATSTQIGGTVTVSSKDKRISRAFAGDILGDGRPEIAFTYTLCMNAYKFNGTTFQPLWNGASGIATTDQSGATTMSMFDFNQDGNVEIVYRDAHNLRIIDKNGANISTIPCLSATHTEYPIIVDLDRDGHADIVVTGGLGPENGPDKIQLLCFGSQTPGAWAPARSVWNQHAYNSVNINEDLTVPRHPFNPTTVFPNGKRPYNNFLQQQTILNSQGGQLWLTPDFVMTGAPNTHYYTVGDSLVISNLCVRNIGEARSGDSLQIALYRDLRAPSNLLRVYKLPAAIDVGATRCYTIKLAGVLSLSAGGLHIEINDDGRRHPQLECDTLSNGSLIAISSIPVARNDRISVFACKSRTAAVLSNDLNASGAIPTVVRDGKLGTATTSGSGIAYVNNKGVCSTHGGRRDTVVYRICNGGNCSDAQLFISILRMPSVQLEDSCSRRPWLTVDYQYSSATYQWHRSTDKLFWTPVDGATGLKLYVTDQAWYKAVITYNGDAVETAPAYFRIHSKSLLQGGLWWYSASLEY